MVKNTRRVQRGAESLSRDHIIEAAIVLLDEGGEAALTFRALAERLGTGAGAIYWHVADKDDVLNAACDTIVAHALDAVPAGAAPHDAIRAIGLALFDAIDVRPWIGAALTQSAGQMPMVRILESIGRQLTALGIPTASAWTTVSALLSYILGVAGQNAANGRYARARKRERAPFLDAIAGQWSHLDPDAFPFTRGVAAQLGTHDDRADFLSGLDLVLAGIDAGRAP